jgi:CheY-like chemotaxis protein
MPAGSADPALPASGQVEPAVRDAAASSRSDGAAKAPLRQILVIDDNALDIELFRAACDTGGIAIDLRSFTDPRKAVQELAQRAADGLMPLPSTIVLDLNMPGMSGYQVLEFLKSHPVLRGVPIYVLTTSDSPRDRERCRSMGADRYLVKPPSFLSFVALLQQVLADRSGSGA